MKAFLAVVGISILSYVGQKFLQEGDMPVSGEGVYVSEGCIHCHSQYVRPGSLDTEIYGPASGLPDGAEGSVLVGNRRQGPDLSAVGLRRSRGWNREHLIDPQSVSPGSRMPSYAHLFEGSAERGEALLDYLESRRGGDEGDWFGRVESWTIGDEEGNAERGQGLFARNCAQCHGEGGKGDGKLAEKFQPRPSNFAAGGFRFVPFALPAEVRREMIGRYVKFGIRGTSMPGHEYLTDEEIADLVSFVMTFSVQQR